MFQNKKLWIHLLFILLLAFILLPRPQQQYEVYSADEHRASFCISAGLYQYGDGLIPVADIFSQYGIGLGAVCGFLFGDTLLETLNRLNLLTASLSLFFLTGLYFLAMAAFRSWFMAALTTLSVLSAQLLVYANVESFFKTPSLGAWRYFQIPFVAFLLGYFGEKKNRWVPIVGLLLGLSLFLSTDAGMAAALAGLFAIFFGTEGKWSHRTLLCLQTLAISLAAFFCFGVFAYGFAFLTQNFLVPLGYLEVYSAGFGAIAQAWEPTANGFIKNHFSNLLILFTLGWWWHKGHSFHRTIFLFLCPFGLLLNFKYINRSFDPYFWGQSFVFFFCLFYWLSKAVESADRLAEGKQVLIRRTIHCGVLFLTLIVAWQLVKSSHAGFQTDKSSIRTTMATFRTASPLGKALSGLKLNDGLVSNPHFWSQCFVLGFCLLYWLATGVKATRRLAGSKPILMKREIQLGLLILTIAATGLVKPSQGRCQFGLPAYIRMFDKFYLTHGVATGDWSLRPQTTPFFTDPSDRELIQTRTPVGGRALILAEKDWVFLLEAQRGPAIFFVPMTDTFLRSSFLELTKTLMKSPLIYFDRDSDFSALKNRDFANLIVPILKKHFKSCGDSRNLTALCRKDVS